VWVLAFILLWFFFLSKEAKPETVIEFGPSILKNEHTESFTLIVQERWAGKYAISIGYISSQHFNACGNHPTTKSCVWELQEQLLVGAERIVTGNFNTAWLNRLSLSIGPYWIQNKNRVSSSNFLIRLGLDIRLWDRASIKISHFSNGGSGEEITIGNPNLMVPDPDDPRLIKRTIPVQHTGRFNVGQDALLFTWRF